MKSGLRGLFFSAAMMLVACLCLPACTQRPVNKAQVFEEIISSVNRYQSTSSAGEKGSSDEEKKAIKEKIKADMVSIGFGGEGNSVDMNEEFISEYLTSHSTDAFLKSLYELQDYLQLSIPIVPIADDYDHVWGSDCYCQEMTMVIDRFISAANLPMITFNRDNKGKEGYYTQNPQAEPQSYTEEESGLFYDSTGQNGSTETVTNVHKVEYYGDFAILTYEGSHYNGGKYEWVNGEFMDVLPYWEPFSWTSLWYKGFNLGEIDGTGINPQQSQAPSNTPMNTPVNISISNIDVSSIRVFPTVGTKEFYYIATKEYYNGHRDETHTFYQLECRTVDSSAPVSAKPTAGPVTQTPQVTTAPNLSPIEELYAYILSHGKIRDDLSTGEQNVNFIEREYSNTISITLSAMKADKNDPSQGVTFILYVLAGLSYYNDFQIYVPANQSDGDYRFTYRKLGEKEIVYAGTVNPKTYEIKITETNDDITKKEAKSQALSNIIGLSGSINTLLEDNGLSYKYEDFGFSPDIYSMKNE